MALIGTPLDAMIRRWAGDEADVERLKERYKEHQWAHHDAMVRAFPGVPDVLDALAARGVRMAVVTSKLEPSARRSLDFLGLSRHFELRGRARGHGAAQARPGAGAVRASERLGARPDEAAFVGDSPHDVRRRQRRRGGHRGHALGAVQPGGARAGPAPGLGGAGGGRAPGSWRA